MTSNPRVPRALVAVLASLLAVAGLISVAQAADPADGKVDKATPKVQWAGTLTSSGIVAEAWNNGQTNTPCEPPTCDPFTLTVADSGAGVNLVIKTRLQNAAAQGNNGNSTIRVTDPAGEVTIYTGESGPDTDLKITVKNAANGVYQIDTTASFVCCGDTDYISTGELTGASFGSTMPPPPGEGSPNTGPATTTGGGEGGGGAPAPTAAPATTLSIKAPAVSARKIKKSRKLTATLTASGPLTNVNLVLVDKKKKLGSLKVARVEGTRKLVLKLGKKVKLKKGKRYQLSAGGTDANGRSVVASAKLTVKK